MLELNTLEQIRSYLVGKDFEFLKTKNIVAKNGSVTTFYFLIERGTSIVYQLTLKDNMLMIKKLFDKSFKDYKVKEVQIISNFTINEISYNESKVPILSFYATLNRNCEKIEIPFIFTLSFIKDSLFYESNLSKRCYLLSVKNKNEWLHHPFLSLEDDRCYAKNQVFVTNDSLGLHLYVKDKVYIQSLNQTAIIHYHFLKKNYFLYTEQKELLPFSLYENELILLERNRKEYITNKNQHTNIVSLYDYLIGPNKETRKFIDEVYMTNTVQDIYENIECFIEDEIKDKKLLLNYAKDGFSVTVQQYYKH